MRELLNDSQWNSLRIALVSFEKRLREAQSWLQGRQDQGKLYERRLAISPENSVAAEHLIAQALRPLGTLAARLDVPVRPERVGSELRGELAISWANLLDCRANKLGRFGDVHPKLSRELDPTIEQLADIANYLAAIFGESDKEKP
jgi:hypothetical protein